MQASFIQAIIQKLGMTKQDLDLFVPPRAIYQKYCRSVIYDLNKVQLDLFMNIVEFDKTDKTVDQRRRALIMFLECNTIFQDTNYIFIWFRIAEEFIKKGKKIIIKHREFQNYNRTEQHNNYTMSFSQKKNIQMYKDEEDDESSDPTYLQYDSDEEEDPDIRNLIFGMKSLKIA